MKEFSNKESEREIAKLKKMSRAKSPVKTNVSKFEAQTRREQRNARLANQAISPTRSKTPSKKSSQPNGLFSPSRSKSPSMNNRPNQLFSPNKIKAAEMKSGRESPSFSISPTKWPSNNNERSKWTFNENSWERESPSESLPRVGDTVDVSWFFDNIDYVTSPQKERFTLNAPSPSEEVMDRQGYGGATESREVYGGTGENREGYSGTKEYREDYSGTTQNREGYGGTIKNRRGYEGTRQEEEKDQVDEEEHVGHFRNTLNYHMSAWDKEVTFDDDQPKRADDFIQRLCDQVRNHVEYLCGMNFVSYKAISYKVRVAGTEGIFYYVKINVWQNYCLHLRIFCDKNELKAVPALQAILERAQPDNGKIEFF